MELHEPPRVDRVLHNREGPAGIELGSRPAFATLQFLHGRIAPLPQREVDALEDDIVNLAALLEGGLAKRLIDALR
jgi:hypothetical protein